MANLNEFIANGHVTLSLEDMYNGCKITIPVLAKKPCSSCSINDERLGSCEICGIRQMKIKFPKGTDSGLNTAYSNDGVVLATVIQEEHQYFTRNKENLFIYVQISLAEALCGFEKPLPFLDGDYIVIHPEEGKVVADQEILVIRGKGMPILNSSKYGDLYVKFNVPLPRRINKQLAKDLHDLLPKDKPPTIPKDAIIEEVELLEYK